MVVVMMVMMMVGNAISDTSLSVFVHITFTHAQNQYYNYIN